VLPIEWTIWAASAIIKVTIPERPTEALGVFSNNNIWTIAIAAARGARRVQVVVVTGG
jgi:hypothetical protein